MWIAQANVTIDKSSGGGVSMSATVSASLSALGHTLSGSVTLAYNSGTRVFRMAASISGPLLDTSVGVEVSSARNENSSNV